MSSVFPRKIIYKIAWNVEDSRRSSVLGSRVSFRSTVLMGTDIFNSYLFFTYVGHPRPSVNNSSSRRKIIISTRPEPRFGRYLNEV